MQLFALVAQRLSRRGLLGVAAGCVAAAASGVGTGSPVGAAPASGARFGGGSQVGRRPSPYAVTSWQGHANVPIEIDFGQGRSGVLRLHNVTDLTQSGGRG